MIRGRHAFLDEDGTGLGRPLWGALARRRFQHGMSIDLHQVSHPYVIRRDAFEQTSGWPGDAILLGAGEDADILIKMEALGLIGTLSEEVYLQRMHPARLWAGFHPEDAFAMWGRLADRTIARFGVPIRRCNEKPPIRYERIEQPMLSKEQIDFVVLKEPGYLNLPLERCLASLQMSGISPTAIHVVSTELGKARARNEVAAVCTKPLLCFLREDIELIHPTTIDAWLSVVNQQQADFVGPFAGNFVPGQPTPQILQFQTLREATLGAYPASWLSAACLLVRREVLKTLGGFDTYGIGEEKIWPKLIFHYVLDCETSIVCGCLCLLSRINNQF